MSGGADWEDPFAKDEAAAERERRRAEREARRRSLAEKVQGQPADAAPPAEAPPQAPASAPAPELPPPPPHTDEHEVAPPLVPQRSYGDEPPRHLLVRRAIGVLVFLAVLALLAFGVKKAIDGLGGGGDSPPVKTTKPVKTTEITVPEGLDRGQIAAVAKKAGLKGDYMKATKKAPKKSGFDLADYDAKGAPNLEGFLFPDTWNDLPKKGTVHDLVDRQLADFQQRFKGVDLSYAKKKNLTPYDVLIIASIIEKEIAVPEERKLAAAVIYNRLAANNPLGMDSTIRYYEQNYDEQLTESELAADEPYNTRIHTGLPPTPISNPGLASLEAAAKPADSDVFYFVIKPGTCNEHAFVETEEEFQQAEAAYQQALQEQGGSPTEC
jgi:cell division protein YceG involved in septum cleavage